MVALAIPELIQPGELYIPDGRNHFALADDALPNGDDALTFMQAAGSNELVAYTDIPTFTDDPHLLRPDPCAMSFWIRRRQNFPASSPIAANNKFATALPAGNSWIMGVADPAAVDTLPASGLTAWGCLTSSVDGIQFVQYGYSWAPPTGSHWTASPKITLPLDAWSLVVVNRSSWNNVNNNPEQGKMTVYLDMMLTGSTGMANMAPLQVSVAGLMRFGLGDVTTVKNSITGSTSDGPVLDLAKLCFHDRILTAADMLALTESMRYGPPEAP